MNQTVGVVIPAYNPDVETLIEYIDQLQEEVADVIHLELDSPEKSTLDALEYLENINILSNRRGKGRAITDGFNTLSTDVLAFADADGATSATSLCAVINPVKNGVVDLSIGSRRHPDATIKSHQTFVRQRLGDIFAWCARRVLSTKLHDYQCGAKALSAELWNTIQPYVSEDGFGWDLEIVAISSTLDYSIKEVPIIWDDAPDSTVCTISTVLDLIRVLLTIRLRMIYIKSNNLNNETDRN